MKDSKILILQFEILKSWFFIHFYKFITNCEKWHILNILNIFLNQAKNKIPSPIAEARNNIQETTFFRLIKPLNHKKSLMRAEDIRDLSIINHA